MRIISLIDRNADHPNLQHGNAEEASRPITPIDTMPTDGWNVQVRF